MFQPASRKRTRARIALSGAAGSGKTYSAIAIGSALGRRLAVIDTEAGSASIYAPPFTFDVVELTHFAPSEYIKAIRAAAAAKYDVLIIDSYSHAWNGPGGVLEIADQVGGQNKFGGWKEATPQHNALVTEILNIPMHVIATMRAKTEYALERDPSTGRNVVRRLGMAPIQRETVPYEFSVVGEMDGGTLTVTKSRFASLAGQSFVHPGADFAAQLMAEINIGDAPPKPPVTLANLLAQYKAEEIMLAAGGTIPSSQEELERVAIALETVRAAS